MKIDGQHKRILLGLQGLGGRVLRDAARPGKGDGSCLTHLAERRETQSEGIARHIFCQIARDRFPGPAARESRVQQITSRTSRSGKRQDNRHVVAAKGGPVTDPA